MFNSKLGEYLKNLCKTKWYILTNQSISPILTSCGYFFSTEQKQEKFGTVEKHLYKKDCDPCFNVIVTDSIICRTPAGNINRLTRLEEVSCGPESS